ncbi:MAG: glycosyltransferase family 2 protein [Deltaproteobacteria bacterium]|nr:glycosyltransferase family 2 protein [Deltaproteobacteria bacterium]
MHSQRGHRITVLIPVYNSAETIGRLVDNVVETLGSAGNLWEIILVNDGSVDNSHEVALAASERHQDVVKYINLMRNFGEHNAVMCGLQFVTGDSVTIIDDDFQNPPSEILKLVKKLSEGYDVVYSYYSEKHHSAFRNLGSAFNDMVTAVLLKKPRGLYLSSFKTIDAALVQFITRYDGPYPYIDGLILRSTTRIGQQLCQHDDRETGKSNYTLRKLVRLWINMFTGFSVLPLRLTSYLGILVSFCSMMMAVYFVFARLFGPFFIDHNIPAGWASTIVAITFFSGLQLVMLGMIGEYLGRLFLTINSTPQFLIRQTYRTGERK